MKELFELFSQSLGPKAYTRPKGTEPMDDRTQLFAMYHKKTQSCEKNNINRVLQGKWNCQSCILYNCLWNGC